MNTSEEMVKLVRTVGGLPYNDQCRILRIVELLYLAPFGVQRRTQRLLRDLYDTEPETKWECATGVDEIIEYLEDAVFDADDYTGTWDRFKQWSLRGNT